MLRSSLTALALLIALQSARAQQPAQPPLQQTYLYKTSLVQAAPGKLLELIDTYKKFFAEESKITGDFAPLWMRHSQGDRWDLMILFPMGAYTEFYKPDRTMKREMVMESWRDRFNYDVAWQEDIFVYGPPIEELRKAFADAVFFHIEMFQSLPGKQAALNKQREMENTFSRAVKAPENFIF